VRSGLWRAPLRCRPGELARLLRCAGAIDDVHRRAVRGPHLYLLALGVRPVQQRRGIGSALLGPALGEAARLGLPCYLETANQANLAFYGRHGFQVVAAGVVGGGPALWGMVRPPT
jgi:ribosomal protein S18 acetylase RimI-like enzyme